MLAATISSLVGLSMLYVGAEWLVRGSSSLGLRLGLSPFAVGLTIVAFGTSAPELAVSMNAAYVGQTDVAIGHVIGSNIANIGLVLGLSAVLQPIHIERKLIQIDMPIMIAAGLLFCLLISDSMLTRIDGAFLALGAVIFIAFNVLKARRIKHSTDNTDARDATGLKNSLLQETGLIIVGLVILTFGGRLLVDGSVQLARLAGISEAVISLTIVATGTSLPELATSLLAASKRMTGLLVGNIIGSNALNLLSVLGASSLLAQIPLGNVTRIDIGVMMLFMLGVIPIAYSGFLISRWEGVFLFSSYSAYVSWLVFIVGF